MAQNLILARRETTGQNEILQTHNDSVDSSALDNGALRVYIANTNDVSVSGITSSGVSKTSVWVTSACDSSTTVTAGAIGANADGEASRWYRITDVGDTSEEQWIAIGATGANDGEFFFGVAGSTGGTGEAEELQLTLTAAEEYPKCSLPAIDMTSATKILVSGTSTEAHASGKPEIYLTGYRGDYDAPAEKIGFSSVKATIQTSPDGTTYYYSQLFENVGWDYVRLYVKGSSGNLQTQGLHTSVF